MYEHMTFETILQRMLDRVLPDIDKRPGSVIYDALAPAAAELAQMYVELDINRTQTYADTASGEELSLRTSEFGVNRRTATPATRRGEFYGAGDVPVNVPIGSRYGISNLIYVIIDQIDTGVFELRCETAGATGNQEFGALLPIEYINGLVRAELSDVIVPGADEESDDALRQRYYAAVNEPAYGGNVADYNQKIGAMDGVGGVKVFPAWAGGGTVKATVIASDWGEPTENLIEDIQTAVDPEVNSGEGLGIAPIGHSVTITGARALEIDVETTVTLADSVSVGQVQEPIADVIAAYLLELRQSWDVTDQIVVRVALIDSAILTVPGVIDVAGTTLNGSVANVTLSEEEIPLPGSVVVNG